MKNRESERTLVTVGNGIDLVTHIVKRVVGGDVADSYDGSALTFSVLRKLAVANFQATLSRHVEK
ncbi:MAG: hypothetical protein P4L77_11285 [Sulfuriferula sp.]|nr:hypothetical protein [Sulfuriferula sp.]